MSHQGGDPSTWPGTPQLHSEKQWKDMNQCLMKRQKKLLLCQKENSEMHEKLLHLDSYIRRENLKFAGIKEEKRNRRFSLKKSFVICS